MQPSPMNLQSQLAQHITESLSAELKKFNPTDQVAWIKENFWVPELKGPILLADYQDASLKNILTPNTEGLLPYSLVLWGDIKKSIKSSIAASVVMSTAWHKDDAEIYIVANDIKQADSRVAHYFRRSLELNPLLRGSHRQRGYRTTFGHNRSFVEAIPIDPSGEAGSNADLIVWSELWGAHQDAQKRMWTEMTLSPTKFGQSMRWVESYAGYKDVSLLLYSLYEAGVKGEKVFPETDWEIYHDLIGRMFCMWNTRPRLPWQTPEYYASEVTGLQDDNEFNRIHRNLWISSVDAFITEIAWNACLDPALPPVDPRAPMVIAMDAAVSNDTFAMVGSQRHPTIPDHSRVSFVKVWHAPAQGKIDFQGTPEHRGPELELDWLMENFNIVEATYDPMQLEDMAGRVNKKNRVWMKPFEQTQKRLISDSALQKRVLNRMIHHSGERDLKEHILNADAQKEVKEERTIRIVKKNPNRKIDAAVALSMADYECMRLNL